MKTYKLIEKKSHLLGMPLEDLGLVIIFFATLVISYNIMNLWLTVSRHFLLIAALISLALLVVLKKVNKSHQPGFLTSWLAFRLKTPRHIFYQKPIYFLSNDDKTNQVKDP